MSAKRPSRRKVYDRRWQAERARFLANPRNLRCGICRQPITLADLTAPGGVHVDHIVPLAQGGDKYDHANLQATHPHCHSRKTYGESLGKDAPVKGCAEDGTPLDPGHPWAGG